MLNNELSFFTTQRGGTDWKTREWIVQLNVHVYFRSLKYGFPLLLSNIFSGDSKIAIWNVLKT